MADLEANFMHLQLMHESLARFSENFGAFLYGLNMNAFCVDFSEVVHGSGTVSPCSSDNAIGAYSRLLQKGTRGKGKLWCVSAIITRVAVPMH